MRPLEYLALASGSPRRLELLTSLGLRVEVVSSEYIEAPLANHTPRELALTHARGKAQAAAPYRGLIVAADTVVDLDGLALGKPQGMADSRAMIERLSGREHAVHTAFTIRDGQTGAMLTDCRTTRVRFAQLEPELITAYVASRDGDDKAGAYGIQGFGATLVDSIDGDYFTVVGFPLAAFARALPALGYQLLPATAAVDAFS